MDKFVGEDNRKNYTEITGKCFIDLPQRLIIHKVLVFHEIRITEKEKDPFLLFGYFKNDRLRNISLVFTSVCCGFSRGEYNGDLVNLLDNVIIDYSKLYHIYFDIGNDIVPSTKRISELSSKMYSLRSIGCYQNTDQNSSILPESFFSTSKFPYLKCFTLETFTEPGSGKIKTNWNDCEFFDRLGSLEITFVRFTEFEVGRFFQTKEKIFRNNLKKLNLRMIVLEEKIIINLPNIEKLKLLDCKNLYVIPSEKKLKEIVISCEINKECELIAKNSRNARKIEVRGKCDHFFNLFEEEDFSNLEKLCILPIGDSQYSDIKKWKFCFHLIELSVYSLSVSNFFQVNDWDKLERLTIKHNSEKLVMDDVKFPSLLFLELDDGYQMLTDEFFCFEAIRLERLNITSDTALTGNGWNEDIFKDLKVLDFKNEFNDSFFQTFEFPNMRKMILRFNETLKDRESWREMKNLEEIEVIDFSGCNTISSWKRK